MFQPSTKLFQSGEQLENNERTTSVLTEKMISISFPIKKQKNTS